LSPNESTSLSHVYTKMDELSTLRKVGSGQA
jgi:hypothetical protein